MPDLTAVVGPRVEPQGWGKRPEVKVIVWWRTDEHGKVSRFVNFWELCWENQLMEDRVPYVIAVIPGEE